MSTPPHPEGLRFGRFELRALEHRLLADGEPVALGGRAFDLLLALAQRAGQLVTRNELIEQVWPGRMVEENNLSVQVNALRKALGGEWLVTVPGHGYRFVAPLAAAAPAAAAMPGPAPGPRTNLPSLQPLLIGRGADLAALGTLIDQHRLVTVVGAGGMGKTRLAQALLQMRATSYPHGVCWVELGSVSDPDALPGAVAVALGVQPGAGDALAALSQATAGMALLLALDNAEHMLDPVARLAQTLLDTAPGLHLLVTSQAPLRLALERVFRLGPLAIPQDTLPARPAQAFSAVALFAERATAADSRFVLTDAQVPAVIALCRELDGNALAIELAAARAPALGVERLLAAMSDRLRVLTGNRNRFAPQRQQTLRAAVAWSHDLLGDVERRLFRRLAVLRGAATLELVQSVAADPPGEGALDDEWSMLDALDALVQRSLVELHLDDDVRPRYQLLETPRAFALEQLAVSGEEAAARTRHAHAVRAAWDAAEDALHAGELGVAEWRRDVGVEIDGAREALDWARGQGDDELALALGSAMLARLPPALWSERRELARLCRTLIERVDDASLQQRAWVAIAVIGTDEGAAARALALARRLGNRYRLYAALCEAARTMTNDPEGTRAECLLDEARALEDPDWPPVRRRSAARLEAAIAAHRGQTARALGLYRRLLQLSQAAGDPSVLTQVNVADLELEADDVHAALRSLRALEAQLGGGRDDLRLALVRLSLATAHLRLDDVDAAREPLRGAWSTLAAMGSECLCGEHAALLAAMERREEAAARLLGAAETLRAARGVALGGNAVRARERCTALVRAALTAERAGVLVAQGSDMAPSEMVLLAFPPLS